MGGSVMNSAIDMLGAETFWENVNMKKGEVESFVGKMQRSRNGGGGGNGWCLGRPKCGRAQPPPPPPPAHLGRPRTTIFPSSRFSSPSSR